MRAAMCVIVRDLIVFGVLTDMMRGRPAVYATFASYDEVAHHSGLSAPTRSRRCASSTSSSARIARARRYAPRPVRDRRALRPRPDAGRDVQAAQRLRAGRARRALARAAAAWPASRAATSSSAMVQPRRRRGDRAQAGEAAEERRLGPRGRRARLGQPRARLPHGGPRRLTLEEIDERHPAADPRAARASARRLAARALRRARRRRARRRAATRYLDDGRVEGEDPLAPFSPTAARHLLRTDGFAHVADIMVGSFYDPMLDEGCAFEELISFHGGLGGPQTRPFILCSAAACRCRRSRSSAPPRCTSCWSAGGRCCSRGSPPGRSALQDGRLLAPELRVVEDAAVVSAWSPASRRAGVAQGVFECGGNSSAVWRRSISMPTTASTASSRTTRIWPRLLMPGMMVSQSRKSTATTA